MQNLTRGVLEVLAGARELDQLIGWVTADVYEHILKRVIVSSRAREAPRLLARLPSAHIIRVTCSAPRDGVVEGVVIVRTAVRVRAVAIRLEQYRDRWRASAINVL